MELGPNPGSEFANWLAQLPPEEAWEWRAPPALLPVQATDFTPLAGRRVIACDQTSGMWVYGMWAATEPHDRNGTTMVGLLDEADWYRRQREPEHVVIPQSYPLSDLWVEVPQDLGNVARTQPDQSDLHKSLRARSIVDDATRPPFRYLRFGPTQEKMTGDRCWVLTPAGPTPDWRVGGEPRRGAYHGTIDFTAGLEGLDQPITGTLVPVCKEDAWFRWKQTGEVPRYALAAPRFVWLE